MKTRFAPSPTGYLHLGHAFSAIECQSLAKKLGGELILRFEDIDFTRVREEYYEAIIEDLAWLGIQPEAVPWKQGDRSEAYQAALDDLIARELVYPCFCTRQELARVDAPHERTPIYAGTCRGLESETVEQRKKAGEPFAWRLNAQKAYELTGALRFSDTRFGEIEVDPLRLGDVVVARKDIQTSYHIAVVVDDAAQGVTHVVRGEDLLDSTHVHRLLQAIWNYPEPIYYHHRLICDENGKRFAKRHQALAIRELRAQGVSVEDIYERLRAEG